MLETQIINKIEEFVYTKPRTIQEIAIFLNKNWRTADRYIEEIEKNFGTISTRVFREGTRGALKIVYWSSFEKVSSTIFQKKLEDEINQYKKKEDFSAFDIYQHILEKNKIIKVFKTEEEGLIEIIQLLLTAKKQVLIFSGNLSFINFKNKKYNFLKTIEELIKNKISIKILSRIDLNSKKNIEEILSINNKFANELIEIRHDENPIRGIIIDNKIIKLKEVKEPTGKINELDKKLFIYYDITDKTWAEWLSKIFWKKFSNSVLAQNRLENLKNININTLKLK